MFKTGVAPDGERLFSYPHGFQGSSAAGFANDGVNDMWFSKCKQWSFDGTSMYGPNIANFSVGNVNNDYCRNGICGGSTGRHTPACGTNCPSYVPPNTCELQYLKLCEDFDANMNPLWVTNCDEGMLLCGDDVSTPRYPADYLVDGSNNPILGLPLVLPTGMCLGLHKDEIDIIEDDGSSGIDSSALFIFDAVVLNFQTAIVYIKSQYSSVGGLPTNLESQQEWNKYVNAGVASFFNTLIPSLQGKQQVTNPLTGVFTGNIEMNVGYSDEDNFMLGDRVSGFVYSMNNFDSETQQLKKTGYYDPISKSYRNCPSGGTLQVLGEPFPCTEPQYRGGRSIPSDMQPNVFIYMSKPMKAALYIFGILLLIETVVWTILIIINWNHKTLKVRQKYVLLFILLALFLGSFKIIIGASMELTEGYCASDYWLGHLAFRFMVLPIAYKLWRVDKLFNNATLKRIKITEAQVIHRASLL